MDCPVCNKKIMSNGQCILVCSNNCLNYFHTKCMTKWIRAVTPFKLPDVITMEELENIKMSVAELKKFDINDIKCTDPSCKKPICLLIDNRDLRHINSTHLGVNLYDSMIKNYSMYSRQWKDTIQTIKNFYASELAWRVIPDKHIRRWCKMGSYVKTHHGGESYNYTKHHKPFLPPGTAEEHLKIQKDGRLKYREALKLLSIEKLKVV